MEASDTGYSGAPVAGAVPAALFFPFISLIAALLLQGSESDPRKLQQLCTWAWISGSWLVLGVVFTATFALITLQ